MIQTRKREHSREPDEQCDLIESCSLRQYLEVYACYQRSDWVVWGDESEGKGRNQVYKNYRVGEIFPPLTLHQSLTDEVENSLAAKLAALHG